MGLIGLIHNPHARKNQKDSARGERLRALLGDAGLFRVTETVDRIDEVAREFREAGISVLCSSGGDGSGHRILSHFHRVYGADPMPAYLPLRSGTMNTIPNALKIRGHSEDLLAEAVRRVRSGGSLPRLSNNSVRLQGWQLGFLAGFGLSVHFLEAYYAGGDVGPMKAARTLGAALGSIAVGGPLAKRMLRKIEAGVEVDGRDLVVRQQAVCLAATITEVGLGIRASYRGNEREGAFHLRTGDVSPLDVGRVFPRIYFGYPLGLRESKFYDGLASRVTVRSSAPFKYMVDGDLYDCDGRLTIEAGPKIDFIRLPWPF